MSVGSLGRLEGKSGRLSKSRAQHACTSGFTLIEVLLAVALSALLLTAVYLTYFSISRSIDAATENQETLETGRTFTELIKMDIRGIRGGQYPFVGKNDVVDGLATGQIEFVTSARLTGGGSGLRRIGYVLVVNDKDDRILLRKESTDLNNPLDNTAKVFEVSRIITGFQLEFYNGTDWVPEWNSTATGLVPKQVRVIIDVADAKGANKRFTTEERIESAI